MLTAALYFLLLSISIPAHAIIGPNMLANSPSEYLLDLEAAFNNPIVTQQIGNELYARDYLQTLTTYDSASAPYHERPTIPGAEYSIDEGQWMWIPTTLNAETGTWYWILKTTSYYVSLFIHWSAQ